MEAWERWMVMASDNLEAAHDLRRAGHVRSSVSRYYAAFAAVHGLGLRVGERLKQGHTNWSHRKVAGPFFSGLLGRDRQLTVEQRVVRERMLTKLWDARIVADYQAEVGVEDRQAKHALRRAQVTVEYARQRATEEHDD